MDNPLSFSSVKLELFSKDGTHLKPASGFVLEAGNKYFLITNRHVLAGGDVAAGGQQAPAVEPYTLKTSLHIHGGEGEKSTPLFMGMRKRITVPLYDESDRPRWLERRAQEGYQPAVDVVALPIQLDLTFAILLNQRIPGTNMTTGSWTKISAIPVSAIDTNVEYGPPDPVYIIGYPLGWAPAGPGKSSAAFWRTSSIASEIHEHGMTEAHVFFVDPCALEGMTGSPVVGMKNDRMKLLGIYSDRSTAEFGANAGFVWDAWLVKELIGAS